MEVHVFERYVSNSDALRDYVLRKVDSLSRYFDKIITLDVVLDVERGRHRVEMVGRLANKKTIKAVATTGDMYASVDQAVGKLQRQLTRYKELLRLERRGAKPAPVPVESEPSLPRIVRMKQQIQKPMSPEEAVLELEARGHDFLVFFNSEDDSPAVIFRRGDGDYGLITAHQ